MLHNCETFGSYIPKELESTYLKLLKACFSVRSSTPEFILYTESGFLPLRSIIYARQLKFYKRFRDSIKSDSRRGKAFRLLLENKTNFLKHYEDLLSKYSSEKDIILESRNNMKTKIYELADEGHYKYNMYAELNPDLAPSPFLYGVHPICCEIIKFQLGSHYLPIETGRWNRTARQERICTNCKVLGDEKHIIYNCTLIPSNEMELDCRISHIWYQPEIFHLFKHIKINEFL